MSYKLIATDLDGTLLNKEKKLSEENRKVLYELADKGVIIVPATGRIYDGLPDCVKELPFLRYLIGVNGAIVSDLQTEEVIYKAEIPLDMAIRMIDLLNKYPVIYDCYVDNKAYITASMYDAAEEFVTGKDLLNLVRRLRRKVPELKSFLIENGRDLQKLQLYSKDAQLRDSFYEIFARDFPDILATTSRECNIELNVKEANKGTALKALADHLGIDMKDVITFGDCSNDTTMIDAAGLGVAMGNAMQSIKDIADYITTDCEDSGVAHALKEIYKLN